MDEREKHKQFEEKLGITRAFRLLWIWNNSYPTGTKYDRDFRTGLYHSKKDNFMLRAKNSGYTVSEINMFLEL